MSNATDPTQAELVQAIHDVVKQFDAIGSVPLGGFAFDRIPCTRRTIYALARKHAAEWGYDYNKAEYIASGNRPFQRNHKRGRNDGPYLSRIRRAN